MSNVFEREVWDLTALPVLVRCPFRVLQGGVWWDYVGIRRNYRSDSIAWDENDLGRWGAGGAAPDTSPTSLVIAGATAAESDAATERDAPLHLESGASVSLSWGVQYDEGATDILHHVRITDAGGAEVYSLDTAAKSADAGVLADGVYLVSVSLTATAKHLTETRYQELTGFSVSGLYFYEQDGNEYFYDYDRNLGVPPSDLAHELNVARAALLAQNAQLDTPAWIQYATSHETFTSGAAVLVLVIGDSEGVVLSPEFCLYSKPTGEITTIVTPLNEGDYGVSFDPLARSVASWLQASDGTLYIGGERATSDGVEGALWELHNDGSATLLATSEHYSTGNCECGGLQQAHEIRRIVEKSDGTICAQSLCSNFRYDPYFPTVRGRLVLYPRATLGHPGGRSLLAKGNVLSWTTEDFSQPGTSARLALKFYNTYQSQIAETIAGGETGTVAHIDGNLALWKNEIYGVVQDRPDSDPDAIRRVAKMTPDGWGAPLNVSCDAQTQRLNRVARIGWHLVATGKSGGEEPIFLSNDGVLIEWGDCDYRLRQIETVSNSTGYETGLAPAFLPTDVFEGLRIPRRVIEIGDRATGRILDSEPETEIDCTDAACQLDDFGPGAVWFGEPLTVWGDNLITGVAVVNAERWLSPSAPKPFTDYFAEKLSTNDALIWARIDSVADVDDLATYIYPVPVLGDLWMLPFPAREKVEFVVVLPEAAGKIPPPRLMVVC